MKSRRQERSLPDVPARTISVISRGIRLEATEIRPCPPDGKIGSVSASSPESTANSSAASAQIRPIGPIFPEASLTADDVVDFWRDA